MTKGSVWIHGLSGKMGQVLEKVIASDEAFTLVGGSSASNFAREVKKIDQADLVIDFSTPSACAALLAKAKESSWRGKTFLICTTGLEASLKDSWEKFGKQGTSKVMIAPNTSLGVLMTLRAALSVAKMGKQSGFDFALEETHHRYKQDAPSGTALFLGESVAQEAGLEVSHEGKRKDPRESLAIHSTRGGGVFGEHTLRLISDSEEVFIGHRALSRDLFATGALTLGSWLSQQSAGTYQLLDYALRPAA